MWLARWLTLGMLTIGVHPQVLTYLEMSLSDSDAVHRVQQDSSSAGIQKIRVAAEHPYQHGHSTVTVLPLSIDSHHGAAGGASHNAVGNVQSRDTVSKRQASPASQVSKAPAKQASENTSRKQSNAQITTKSEALKGGQPPTGTIGSVSSPQVEPKSNQYGIGNTLVVLVEGANINQPSYVDQSQPHRVVEPNPLKPPPGAPTSALLPDDNFARPVVTQKPEDGPQPKELERRPEYKHGQSPPAQQQSQPVPVRQQYYDNSEEKSGKEQYDPYGREQTITQPKPFVPPYEEVIPSRTDLNRNPPRTHESPYETIRAPIRTPDSYEAVRAPSKRPTDQYDSNRNQQKRPEESYQVVKTQAKQRPDDYEVIPTPNKPLYDDIRNAPRADGYSASAEEGYSVEKKRPVYGTAAEGGYDDLAGSRKYAAPAAPARRPERDERPPYIELKPAYSQQAAELPSAEYTGFPESHQPNRGTGVSRPLQFDPPRVFPPSPCNSVFQYEGREPGEDSWSGDIYLTTEDTLIGVRLDIILDRPARLLANWLAEAESRDNRQFTILSLHKRLVPGPPEAVRITVRFPSQGAIPYLQSINLNGRSICPIKVSQSNSRVTTRRPVYENPGDVVIKPTTEPYREVQPARPRPGPGLGPALRPDPTYEQPPATTTTRNSYQQDRRTTTEAYRPAKRTTQMYEVGEGERDPNPNYYEGNDKNRVPTQKPSRPFTPTKSNQAIGCGSPAVQPKPLVTYGQLTNRGQWPWHAAIYKNVGVDLSYICGGSLISTRHVVTAAHCVTSDFKAVDASALVVYLGKYHLRLWSEGGVQNKQVSEVVVHEAYNKTAFKADLAVLVLSSPVEFTEFIRPVCLWDRTKTDISQVENKVGIVIGWGFDETKQLTEELMQAHMPIVNHNECLWSYPEFFPKFTSNLTYCAGFRNGTSVCNGDSGGGMVFPMRVSAGGKGEAGNAGEEEQRWYLRGLVSISVAEKDNRVCDTRHFVVFTDLAQFLPWLEKYV